jgi:SAM-dependent methyltransferase
VRCDGCNILYCNPRPKQELISLAVQSGSHELENASLNVKARRKAKAVARYKKIFSAIFSDLWESEKPIKWLDVGAGYGEVLEAISALAPAGSLIEGLEPMQPKAEVAVSRGLKVTQDYLHPDRDKVNVISVVDVFSHIPNFRSFLSTVVAVLESRGELFVETGNLADISSRSEFPGELGLPDHLVFAGESHLIGYLQEAGFDIVSITRERSDGFVNLAKQVAKKILGRPSNFRLPYTSTYRQVRIRARLRA